MAATVDASTSYEITKPPNAGVSARESTIIPSVGGREAAANAGVVWFFTLTFGLSWAAWWLIVLLDAGGITGASSLRPLKDLAAFSPSLVALGLCARSAGWNGVRELLGQALRWRIGLVWYLIALFGPLFVALAALTITRLSGGSAAWPELNALLVFPLVLVVVLVLFGPLGEEFGWRGFALPGLQASFSARQASLLLGVIWGVWHLPLFFMSGTPQSELSLPLYLSLVAAQSVLYTWIYNSTGGSLTPILLIHAAGNGWTGLTGVLPGDAGSDVPFLLLTGITWIVALAVLRVTDPRTLRRSES